MNMAIRDLTLVPTTLDAVEAFQFRPSAYDPVFTDLFIPVFNGTVELGVDEARLDVLDRLVGLMAHGSRLAADD
jgi:hypothetical protein